MMECTDPIAGPGSGSRGFLNGVDFVFDWKFFLQVLDVWKKVTHVTIVFAVRLHPSCYGEIFIELFFTRTLGPLLLVATNTQDVFVLLRFVLTHYDAMRAICTINFFHRHIFWRAVLGSRLFAVAVLEGLVDELLQPVNISLRKALKLEAHGFANDPDNRPHSPKRPQSHLELHIHFVPHIE